MAEGEEDGFGAADSSASWLALNISSVDISIMVYVRPSFIYDVHICASERDRVGGGIPPFADALFPAHLELPVPLL